MCVYKIPDGVCRNFSDTVHISYCVEGPCPHDTPSNADHIRAMSDEELANLLCINGWRLWETSECLDWLRQPWEEAPHD